METVYFDNQSFRPSLYQVNTWRGEDEEAANRYGYLNWPEEAEEGVYKKPSPTGVRDRDLLEPVFVAWREATNDGMYAPDPVFLGWMTEEEYRDLLTAPEWMWKTSIENRRTAGWNGLKHYPDRDRGYSGLLIKKWIVDTVPEILVESESFPPETKPTVVIS
jgi:hypothetical protein